MKTITISNPNLYSLGSLATLLLAGIAPLLACAAAAPATEPSAIAEERLGDWADRYSNSLASTDGLHIAVVTDGATRRVVWDGKPGPVYPWIGSLGFSRDGLRFWHTAEKEVSRRHMLVVDGVEWPDYEVTDRFFEIRNVQVSLDGSHIACWVPVGDSLVAYVDGKTTVAGPRSPQGWVVFSPDLSQIACAVGDAPGRRRWWLDGKELPGADGNLYFSPDGKHVAYTFNQGGKYAVVYDGKQGRGYDVDPEPVFSPNSQHWAYIARDFNGQYVVFDGQEGPRHDSIRSGMMPSSAVLFSPDSRHCAYIARDGDEWTAILDGVPQSPSCGKAESFFGELMFTPDSATLVYQIGKPDGTRAWVVGGKEMPCYGGQFVFSPDSRRLGYSKSQAHEGNERVMVVDGQAGPVFSWIGTAPHQISRSQMGGGDTGFQFSPDSRHFGYVGLEPVLEPVPSGNRAVMVLDHQPGRPYSDIPRFTFSPDSKHLAYLAETAQRTQVVVLDGREGREYAQIIRGGPTFAADGTLEYLGIRDGGLYRIRVKPE